MSERNATVSVAEAAARRRQKLLLFGSVGVVGLIAVAMAVLTTPAKQGAATKQFETKPIQIGGTNLDKEAFSAQFRADQERLRRELEELRQWRKQQEERQRRDDEERVRRVVATQPSTPPSMPPTVTPGGQPVFNAPTQPGPPPLAQPSAPAATATAARVGAQAAPVGLSLKVLAVAQPAGASGVAAAANASSRSEAGSAADKGAPRDASVENYVPAGSFARAVMLNGLDAPTGGNAQQNPHPVLLQLLDDATLPNRFKSRLQSCFLTAAAHGDISSERAFVRLDRLSCIDEQGGAVDMKVHGYVAGEDGKTGIRGRLVTKSGQVLANALLTGLLSGIGKGIQADATQQNTTITGAVTTQVTNPWRAGIGEGMGKAMEDVSRYYLRLADKIFPIIEVDAGRVVDVVFTRGLSMEKQVGGNN